MSVCRNERGNSEFRASNKINSKKKTTREMFRIAAARVRESEMRPGNSDARNGFSLIIGFSHNYLRWCCEQWASVRCFSIFAGFVCVCDWLVVVFLISSRKTILIEIVFNTNENWWKINAIFAAKRQYV